MSEKGTDRWTVLQGDALEHLSDLEENSAHAAVVDYPWKFEIQNNTGRFETRNAPRGTGAGDRDLEDDTRMFDTLPDKGYTVVLEELSRALEPGSWLVSMADDRFQDVVRESIRDHPEWILRRNWAWTPGSMGMGTYGRVSHYPIPVATLGETSRYVRDRGTLFEVRGGRNTEYPTGKPVELYREILRAPVVYDGERLLEPFCGSGPGAVVAAERDLEYWGCDVDVDAVEITKDRFAQQRLTGQITLTDGGMASKLHPDTENSEGQP